MRCINAVPTSFIDFITPWFNRYSLHLILLREVLLNLKTLEVCQSLNRPVNTGIQNTERVDESPE